jgi:nitrogen regulatory protein P-II 1
MKLVTAVVHPSALGDVRSALRDVGVSWMTVTEAHDVGHGSAHVAAATRGEDEGEFVPRLRIEILVDHVEADFVAEAVAPLAATGHAGVAAVWVATVEAPQGIGVVGRDAVAVA